MTLVDLRAGTGPGPGPVPGPGLSPSCLARLNPAGLRKMIFEAGSPSYL